MTLKEPKVRKKMQRVTADERQLMLFWWTVYGGNNSKVARKVSSLTGISRSRKVVQEVSKRHNFATLSHVVRDQVNKHYFGQSSPGMNRMMSMIMDLMEVDEQILRHSKNYLAGSGKTKISSFNELINGMKYVTQDLEQLTGRKGLKHGSAFESVVEENKPEISISVNKVLDELPDGEKEELIGQIIDKTTAKILDYKD